MSPSHKNARDGMKFRPAGGLRGTAWQNLYSGYDIKAVSPKALSHIALRHKYPQKVTTGSLAQSVHYMNIFFIY
jgi:hypothetical protein